MNKEFNENLSGNEVDRTISLILLVGRKLYNELHYQTVVFI